MNKNIGIETIYRDVLLTNYGSFWQHFALRMVLKEMGFHPFRCENGRLLDEVRILSLPLRIARIWVLSVLGFRKRPDWNACHAALIRWRFVWDYWSLIGKVFEHGRRAFAYIAGGDSVWCMTERHYFLLDKPVDARRISYAASSAWDKLSKNAVWSENVKEVVDSFHKIGVRENAGAKIVGSHAEVVIDPVLLCSRETFDRLIPSSTVRSKRFVLYYAVNVFDAAGLNLPTIKHCADELQCSLRIVGIQGAGQYIPDEYKAEPSPRSFLSLVRDAEFLVTNSFHGLVFALLFNKRFVFVQQSGHIHGNQNLRQTELLVRLSMQDWIQPSSPNADKLIECLSRDPDWGRINSELAVERMRCRAWLKDALS